MKSYTDIEQSKKLAEILPLESADMARCGSENVIVTNYISAKKEFSVCDEITITPCWSLAALLGIIRKAIGGYSMDCISKNIVMSVELGDRPWKLETDTCSNEIDNCYDMILKLHKEGLIMAT